MDSSVFKLVSYQGSVRWGSHHNPFVFIVLFAVSDPGYKEATILTSHDQHHCGPLHVLMWLIAMDGADLGV